MSYTDLEFLRELRCTALPEELWRVQHGGSQAEFDREGNLLAKLSDHVPKNQEELCMFLVSHFKWGRSQANSCFLSMLDIRQEAVNWGKARYQWAKSQPNAIVFVELFKIDSHLLGDIMVFKVDELLTKLDLRLKRDTSHEYLVLSHVPAKAIQWVMDISEMMWAGNSAL